MDDFSKTGKYFDQPPPKPSITPAMVKSVSEYRRATLQDELEKGHFRDPSSNSKYGSEDHNCTPMGQVIAGRMRKTAVDIGSTTSSSWRGHGGSVAQTPQIYSPLWLNSNLSLPRDRATINAWCRSFGALNPMVHNALDLHSTYPISKLNITCKSKKIQDFFEDMNEEIDLMNVCIQIAKEYWTIGEAFIYAELNESSAKWSRLSLQNPDYITVRHSVVAGEPIISLRPDENLKKIITSNKPADVQQRQSLNPAIVEHVKRGENIPLGNFYTSHIARKLSPYETRGTGLVVSIFKVMMLMDKIREAKLIQFENMINPLTLVKIGSEGFKPGPADLQAWREVFETATADQDFKIFTHEAVTVERVGYNQGILDTSNDVTQLLKEIYVGLMVPSVLMDGGADTSYANGGVALDVLRQRYMQFRNILTIWLRRKIFAPICRINEFYEKKDGKNVLIVPDIDWNHMSLFDTADYIQNLVQLTTEPKRVSIQTLHRSLGLDYEEEIRKMEEEQIREAILLKQKTAMEGISLEELRGIKSGEEIKESVNPEGAPPSGQEPLPGETLPGESAQMPPPTMPEAPSPPPTPPSPTT